MAFKMSNMLRPLFNGIDTDGDGHLSKDEFSTYLMQNGYELSWQELGDVFAAIDTNEDGELSFDEFVEALKMIESVQYGSQKRKGDLKRDDAGMNELKLLFDAIDTDGDGALSKEEFNVYLSQHGYDLSWEEFEDLFESFDKDNTEELSFDEFVEALRIVDLGKLGTPKPTDDRGATSKSRSELRRLFDSIDTDHSGNLSKGEFNIYLAKDGYDLSWQEFEDLFESIDTDHSGELCFDEFVKALHKINSGKKGTGKHMDDPGDTETIEMQLLFDTVDTDNSGTLSKEQFNTYLRQDGYDLSWEEFEDLFEETDTDQKGELSFEEFVKSVRKLDLGNQRTPKHRADRGPTPTDERRERSHREGQGTRGNTQREDQGASGYTQPGETSTNSTFYRWVLRNGQWTKMRIG